MDSIDRSQLASLDAWIEKASKDGAVPILCGENGDMDTIGSAIALASAIPRALACGLSQDKVAKRICEETKAPFRFIDKNSPSLPKKIGGIICVDAASPSQIGIELPNGVPVCVIDHHPTDGWELGEDDMAIKWPVRATTQIVFSYLREFHEDSLTEPVRKLLLAGLITDTGRFRHADKQALSDGAEILNGSEIDYASFVEVVERDEINDSERGSMIAGLSRVKATTAGDWHLMYTNVGANEGRMCRVLLTAGAEVALTSRYRDGITRLSSRATRKATLSGVHLGNLMESISEKLGGEGGGHDGAAGWSGEVDRVAAESAFIHALSGVTRGD